MRLGLGRVGMMESARMSIQGSIGVGLVWGVQGKTVCLRGCVRSAAGVHHEIKKVDAGNMQATRYVATPG